MPGAPSVAQSFAVACVQACHAHIQAHAVVAGTMLNEVAIFLATVRRAPVKKRGSGFTR